MTTASLFCLLLLSPQTILELEGQRVASVRIEIDDLATSGLARYLELSPGDPFRVEAVRHVVELLHATGRFQDVLVSAEPGPDGLAVVVRPVPAPLLSGIALHGDRVLKPGEIRSVARLRDGEPLWPERLEQASSDVRVALVDKGYLDARVAATSRWHGPGAEALFTIDAGSLARVGRARLEGVSPPLAAGLASLIAPRSGEVFKRRRTQRAAERMRSFLTKKGHWKAQVAVEEGRDPATERVDLGFRISPGPRMRVEFRGSPQPDKGMRKAVLGLLREGSVKTDALEEAAERVEDALRRRGHRAAMVSHEEEAGVEESVVVYTIDAGPIARIGSVRVASESLEGLEALLTLRPGEVLVDRLVEENVGILRRALEERGYAEGRVEAEVGEGGGVLPVVFRAREGERITVAAISIDQPTPAPTEGSLWELRLRPGRPYRLADVAADRNALIAAYRDGGYPQVEVTPEVALSEDKKTARIVLHVSPGPRVDVDHVVIAGLRRTREEVIRRELLLKEGEPLGLQKVLESQRRLSALGVFRRLSITEMDPESEGKRSLVVFAEEAPATTVAYGIGYAERDRLRGSVEVSRRNLFGMDRSLSTFARVSFTGSRLLATYREPYLFRRKQELFITAFREEEDRPFFDFVRFGGLLQTVFPLSPAWNLVLRYTYQRTDTFNIENPSQVGREFAASTLSGPSASIINDTRDDPLDPHRGHFLSADIVLSHARLGGNSFTKGFLQASTYRRLSARSVLAMGARVGLARTFGLEEPLFLPEADRFYAGGDYSLRGFSLDAVNPSGGNGLLLAGIEMRVDAGRTFSGAAFGEAGNVYSLVSEVSLRELRYTAGVGVRYRSAFGPLRLDWGYKLNRRPGESPSRIHFTVGHAF